MTLGLPPFFQELNMHIEPMRVDIIYELTQQNPMNEEILKEHLYNLVIKTIQKSKEMIKKNPHLEYLEPIIRQRMKEIIRNFYEPF